MSLKRLFGLLLSPRSRLVRRAAVPLAFAVGPSGGSAGGMGSGGALRVGAAALAGLFGLMLLKMCLNMRIDGGLANRVQINRLLRDWVPLGQRIHGMGTKIGSKYGKTQGKVKNYPPTKGYLFLYCSSCFSIF